MKRNRERHELIDKHSEALAKVGLGAYMVDLSDCDEDFIEALGRFCRQWIEAKEDDSCGQNI